MPETDFRAVQRAFTAHLRDRRANPRPADVPAARMQVYRELLLANFETALGNCYPVLHSLLDDPTWNRLVREFFAGHRCQSPLYRDLPGEFREWLRGPQHDGLRARLPFLDELAHYEWVEMTLDTDPRTIPTEGIDRTGDLLAGVPVLNPLAWLLRYRFPVPRIGPEFRPGAPQAEPVQLVIHRRRDHSIGFLEVNPLVAALVGRLETNADRTGRQLLTELAGGYPQLSLDTFLAAGATALSELAGRDIVLGTRAA